MKQKVFIAADLPETAYRILEQAGFEFAVYRGTGYISGNELLQAVEDADALIPLLAHKIDACVIAAGKKLKIIANYAVGYNNIDLEAARKNQVIVTNTPGVLTETTADLAFGAMIAVARKIAEGDKMVREGRFKGWQAKLLLGCDVYGKTLGIIGMGRIGQAMARRGLGFGMKIIYAGRSAKTLDFPAEFIEIRKLMSKADFILLSLPLNQETRGIINRSLLSEMKPEAFLINIARGEILDEEFLISLLERQKISGAALDVFQNEPEINPRLCALQNTILTPHIGSASLATRDKMAAMAAGEVVRVLSGKPAVNRVI
ncbi:MAG: D-glycerate dehydrogenase [Candidatus Wallbacteria bacterium]|nr:D-glycerate dehydrogenase [Candidatus Wallbacteria bacterium]